MSATFLRKYNTIVSGVNVISIPLIKYGETNFALSGDWTPVAGDVVISKDNNVFSNITNLPAPKSAGNTNVWDFYLSASECSAKQTRIIISDAVTKAVEDDCFIVEFYGNPDAMHTIDYSTITQDVNGYIYSDIAAWSGTNLPEQTDAGIPDVNMKNILGNVSAGAAGYVGLDWSAINAPSSNVNLSDTTVANLTNLPTMPTDWVTASGLSDGAATEIANSVLGSSVSNVEDTAAEHSLATVVLQSTESSISANTLTVKKTDGSTTYLTKTLTKTAGDAPIRGIT